MEEVAANGSENRPVWLEVTVLDDDYLSDLQPRVQALAEGLAVEILLVRRGRREQATSLAAEQRETLSELTPEQVFARRLGLEALAEADLAALNGLHDQVLADLREQA
jgi:exonuclease SbcD